MVTHDICKKNQIINLGSPPLTMVIGSEFLSLTDSVVKCVMWLHHLAMEIPIVPGTVIKQITVDC